MKIKTKKTVLDRSRSDITREQIMDDYKAGTSDGMIRHQNETVRIRGKDTMKKL